MNSISLFKYYRRATLIPLASTIIGGIILVTLHDDKESQSNLLSDNNFGQFVFLLVLFSISICILKSTIFLSRYKAVTDNWFVHVLSWMLLPLSFLGVMLYKQVSFLMDYLFDGWEHPPYETEVQIMFGGICIMHILFNIISFIQFRRGLAKSRMMDEETSPIPLEHNPSFKAHNTTVTHHR